MCNVWLCYTVFVGAMQHLMLMSSVTTSFPSLQCWAVGFFPGRLLVFATSRYGGAFMRARAGIKFTGKLDICRRQLTLRFFNESSIYVTRNSHRTVLVTVINVCLLDPVRSAYRPLQQLERGPCFWPQSKWFRQDDLNTCVV